MYERGLFVCRKLRNPENKSQVCSDGASDLCCPGAAEHYSSSHTLGLSNRASKPLAYIHVIRFGHDLEIRDDFL